MATTTTTTTYTQPQPQPQPRQRARRVPVHQDQLDTGSYDHNPSAAGRAGAYILVAQQLNVVVHDMVAGKGRDKAIARLFMAEAELAEENPHTEGAAWVIAASSGVDRTVREVVEGLKHRIATEKHERDKNRCWCRGGVINEVDFGPFDQYEDNIPHGKEVDRDAPRWIALKQVGDWDDTQEAYYDQ